MKVKLKEPNKETQRKENGKYRKGTRRTKRINMRKK